MATTNTGYPVPTRKGAAAERGEPKWRRHHGNRKRREIGVTVPPEPSAENAARIAKDRADIAAANAEIAALQPVVTPAVPSTAPASTTTPIVSTPGK